MVYIGSTPHPSPPSNNYHKAYYICNRGSRFNLHYQPLASIAGWGVGRSGLSNHQFSCAMWVSGGIWKITQLKMNIIFWVVVSNIFYFHPYLGEMIQFDKYFSKGLKPPTRKWTSSSIHLHFWGFSRTKTRQETGVLVAFWRSRGKEREPTEVVGRLQDLHSSFGDLWKTFLGWKKMEVKWWIFCWCGGWYVLLSWMLWMLI